MAVYAAVYVAAMSAAGFLLCAYDKRAAIKRKRRVSERALLILSAAGGSVGVYAAMLILRHKTRHIKFMLFVPVMILLQVGTALWALKVF
jgi:uncharacterized membrane protein YsdA (DUF1294 family)